MPGQHEQGTEARECLSKACSAHRTTLTLRRPRRQVKAVTYSAMQIHDREGDAEVFVIVDI